MQITWWITLIVLYRQHDKKSKYYLLISQFNLGVLSTDISLRGLLHFCVFVYIR